MENFTTTHPVIQAFPKYFAGILIGIMVSMMAVAITSVAAAPTPTEIAHQALSQSFNAAMEIQKDCDDIHAIAKSIESSTHDAAGQLGK